MRPARIPRSVPLPRPKPKLGVRRAHKDFLHALGICIACGRRGPVEVAHVRESRAEHGKFNTMSRLADDRFTLPLCTECHIGDQHGKYGEPAFWARLGIDPIDAAMRLFAVTGDLEQGLRTIARTRQAIALHARAASPANAASGKDTDNK